MEMITAAAVRLGNDIVCGPTHSAVLSKIPEQPGVEAETKAKMMARAEFGFLTTEGRFISREEAFKVASAAQQLIENELVDPANNMKYFNSVEPRLESSMLRLQ